MENKVFKNGKKIKKTLKIKNIINIWKWKKL